MRNITYRAIGWVLFFSAVCSAATDDILEYRGTAGLPGNGKRVVLISGDEEYRSEEMVVQFGRILAVRHGFDCTVLFAINKETGEIDPTTLDNIPGLEALEKADLMVIATRFRNLPDEQMRRIDDYLMSGRPVIGLRTATHAFNIPKGRAYARYSFNHDDGGGPWQQGFGRLVLGETWIDHHGKHGKEATRGIIIESQKAHPILRGCTDIFGPTDVYTVRLPQPAGCIPLVSGQVLTGMQPTDPPLPGPKNDPMMPLVWIKSYQLPGGKEGRCLTTTMGSSQDFESEGLRRLLVNAAYYLVDLEKSIAERTDVAIVGEYRTLPMGFAKHQPGKKPADWRLK